ncbi:hypothetical protein AKJ18_16830 [Vibrio xuii]|nr:hypothetical protein AKJ18_16830 [Vibrio xuii]
MKHLLSLLLLVSVSAIADSELNKPLNGISEVKSKPVSGQITFKGRILQEPCALDVRNFSMKSQQKTNGCVEYTAEKIEIINKHSIESSSVLLVSYI